MDTNEYKFTPTGLINSINGVFSEIYPQNIILVGEVASFKISQGKWVFFDVKDETSSINCFMTLYQLNIPLSDGMKVVMSGEPNLTRWGKFSFIVKKIQPLGEGSIKKAFELLKAKLEKEGLFDPLKKRPLPENLTKIGVISSTNAAGYADFIKILNARYGGLKIQVANVQVQGLNAPEQIRRALQYFNEQSEVEVIAILRGGGSKDDLSCFNDEALVRAVASSKIPVITGIGHEIDESLVDLAADVRASTPSNAAEMLSKDRGAEIKRIKVLVWSVKQVLLAKVKEMSEKTGMVFETRQIIFAKIAELRRLKAGHLTRLQNNFNHKLRSLGEKIAGQIKLLEALNPEKVLSQGYAIISGKISPGNVVKITTHDKTATARIENIKERET